MIPSLLLTQPALTYIADRLHVDFLRPSIRNPKLPRVSASESGEVLWDALTECGALPVQLKTEAQYWNQATTVNRWFVLDAIWSAIRDDQWGDHPSVEYRLKQELRDILDPNAVGTPFVGPHAEANTLRHGTQERFWLLKRAEVLYKYPLSKTTLAHAAMAAHELWPYEKTIMAYAANKHHQRARASRRLNLIMQVHTELPDPFDVALAQQIFRGILPNRQPTTW